MTHAADQDYQANMAKQPATAKLRMLSEVMEVLQKYVSCTSLFIIIKILT